MASLDQADERKTAADGLENQPPKIVFAKTPTVLITIDGKPELEKVEGSQVMRVRQHALRDPLRSVEQDVLPQGGHDVVQGLGDRGAVAGRGAAAEQRDFGGAQAAVRRDCPPPPAAPPHGNAQIIVATRADGTDRLRRRAEVDADRRQRAALPREQRQRRVHGAGQPAVLRAALRPLVQGRVAREGSVDLCGVRCAARSLRQHPAGLGPRQRARLRRRHG